MKIQPFRKKNQSRIEDPDVTLEQVLLAAEQVMQRVRTLLGSVGPQARSAQFYTRTRAKTSDSVTGKIESRRREEDTPDYSFRDLTDYVGVRIITLYDDQIVDAQDHILDIIKAGQTTQEPLFQSGSIWELFHDAKFCARTTERFNPKMEEAKQFDVYYQCCARLFKTLSAAKVSRDLSRNVRDNCNVYPRRKPRHDDSKDRKHDDWYSSAHLTFWATAYLPNRTLSIPVEFQIRTAIEDVWAEINHKLLYKIRSQLLWSVKYEESLREAGRYSKELKSHIESLEKDIAGFRSNSNRANGIARDYWGDRGIATDWMERSANQHVSLCAALVSMVDDGNLTSQIGAVLGKYERTISSPMSGRTAQENAQTLVAQMKSLSALGRELKASPAESEIHQKRNFQRYLLLELEVVRLEILVLTQCHHRVIREKNNLRIEAVDPAANQAVAETCCIGLYRQLCDFIDPKKGLEIKPLAMMHAWKFLTAINFDQMLARENIMLALSYLKTDPTLPRWSIYHVVIPSNVAAILHDEAEHAYNLIRVGQAEISYGSNFAVSNKEKLRDAITFAAQAFQVHNDSTIENIERRGDIGFMRQDYAPISDAILVMKIAITYHNQFRSFAGAHSSSVEAKINAARSYLHHHVNLLANQQESEANLLPEEMRVELPHKLGMFDQICMSGDMLTTGDENV